MNRHIRTKENLPSYTAMIKRIEGILETGLYPDTKEPISMENRKGYEEALKYYRENKRCAKKM